MIRFSPANACAKSDAASELVELLPGISLLKATKPPLASCRMSWRFAGFCAAAVNPKA
jgi:hypothetical protein